MLPYRFCLVLLGAISKYKPPGAYIRRGDLTEGFLRYDFGGLTFGGGLIHGGAYFRNFTVFFVHTSPKNSTICLKKKKKTQHSRSPVQ